MKRLFLLITIIGWCSLLYSQSEWDTYSDTWVAVDELGREVQSSENGLPAPKDNKTAGMFYYICFGPHGTDGRPIFDITELLKKNPESPEWGQVGETHWWSKPVLDYYVNGDPYVYEKHLQMLCDAGIDFLFFDVTNAFTYDDAVRGMMNAIKKRKAVGMKVPKLCYMVNAAPQQTIKHLYETFYTDPNNDQFWFEYEGKPLILADRKEAEAIGNPELLNRFTFRRSWAWMQGKNPNEWAWLENYPQPWGWSTSKFNPEQLSVSTAQHATTKIGKSYHGGKEPSLNEYALCDETPYGLYFEEQWKRAHEVNPPLLMVTQFNEWTAGRFVVKNNSELGNTRPGVTPAIGETYFVDAYNAEFNRDIEPSWNPAIRDNYYMQLVSHLRRYKGVRPIPTPSKAVTIVINSDMSQWTEVQPEFRDDIGDITHRNTGGFQNMAPVVNKTGRNDIVVAKMTKDVDNLFCYVRTHEAMTNARLSKQWMMLFLNTDVNYKTGWCGYDFLVYKDPITKKYSLCRNTGNEYNWEAIAPVAYVVQGNELHLAIPKSLLGISEDCDIDFKWADNTPEYPDILDFITEGDVAPNMRFNYRYKGSLVHSQSVGVERHTMGDFTIYKTGGHKLSFVYSLNSPSDICFMIYDTNGLLLQKISCMGQTGKNSVDCSVPAGCLIVKAIWNNQIKIKKIII